VRRLIESGATDYMTKPFDIPRLLALIDGHGAPSGNAADLATDVADDVAAERGTAVLDGPTVLSLHELGDLSLDGAEQLRQLVELFLYDTATRLAELAKVVRDGDNERVAALAHSLAGSCANLGARELAEMCRELEREAKTGGAETAPKLPALNACFDGVRIALKAEFLGSSAEATR
jgi:HPt (histidine-containing phosphotransfer) domain-containing protein